MAESPYQLRVLAGDPCLKQTRVLGPTAPLRAEGGGEVQVRVQLRDGLGNPCSGAKALQLLPVQVWYCQQEQKGRALGKEKRWKHNISGSAGV